MQDKQYAAFQSKLTPGVPPECVIGIRVPELRKFAKEFAKEVEVNDFVRQLPQLMKEFMDFSPILKFRHK